MSKIAVKSCVIDGSRDIENRRETVKNKLLDVNEKTIGLIGLIGTLFFGFLFISYIYIFPIQSVWSSISIWGHITLLYTIAILLLMLVFLLSLSIGFFCVDYYFNSDQ